MLMGTMLTSITPLLITFSCGSTKTTTSNSNSYESITYNRQSDGNLLVDVIVNQETLGHDSEKTYYLLSEYAVNQISSLINTKYNSETFSGILFHLNNFAIKNVAHTNSRITLQDIKNTLSSHFS